MQITLNGRVKAIIAPSMYSDRRRRIEIKVEGSDVYFSELRVPDDGKFVLDQVVSIVVSEQEEPTCKTIV